MTCRERDADTVKFTPTTTPFTPVSTYDYLRQAATDLVYILCAPKNNIPSLTYGSPTTNGQTAYEILKTHGEAPNIHILDNECSRDMKTILKEAQVE